MIKHIFITLSHKDIGDMTLNLACEKLLLIDKYAKVLGVQEKHSNESLHYHIIIIVKEGLSKHTYRNKIRRIYPDIKGHGIHIEGIRRIVKTGKYLLKDVHNSEHVITINIKLQDFVLKYIKNIEIYAYFSIIGCSGSLNDWLEECLENRIIYFKNTKKVITIWDYTKKSKISSLDKLKFKILNTAINLDPSVGYLEKDIPHAQCVLLIKFCLRIFSKPEWKRTNMLLTGEPNVGKTSFLKKFEEVFRCELYWAPARIGDLRGFDSKHGMIILDDVIRQGNKWPIAMLLKMLGREGFKGDAKIKDMVDIPAGIPVVVITNYPSLFTSLKPLQQRLFKIHLTESFSWVRLTADQFMSIIYLTVDGVTSMSEAELKKWNYHHDCSTLDPKSYEIAAQLQLAINAILSKEGNTTKLFPNYASDTEINESKY